MNSKPFPGKARSRTRSILITLPTLLFSALLLSACGGDSSDSVTPPLIDTQPTVVTTVSGGVAKGPVAGATIKVFAVDSSGQKTGNPIATATTDESGQYSIQLTNFSGVYIVEATGGGYVDEATGATRSIPESAPLRAVSAIDASSSTTTVRASVSPLTEIATQVAQRKSGGLTAANVDAGNNEVGALFFGSADGAGAKLLTTAPADITKESSATATDDERLYGLILAATSQLQANTGDLSTALTAIANDLADDGNLDDSSADLITAVNTIVAGTTNNSGVTSATKITNILSAAASGPGTVVALSSDAEITAFKFADSLQTTIDKSGLTVAVLQPAGTDTATLESPTIAISLGATITATDGEDFSDAVTYQVTAEDGTTSIWTVTVTVATSDASPIARITGATSNLITNLVINNTAAAVVGSVASLDDLAALDQVTDPTTLFSISEGATIEALSGNSYQLGDVIYTITAQDGSTVRQWSVLLRVNDPQPQPAFSITNGNLDLLVTSSPVQLQTSGGVPEATLSYASGNTNVVTVDAGGVLTVVGAGTAGVSAKKDRIVTLVAEYLEATASITVTVQKLEQTTLEFPVTAISVSLNGLVVDPLGRETLATTGGSGDGLVSYTSSNTGVATVGVDGAITLVATGTTTISAIKAGDATYLESNTASYTLTVTQTTTATCILDQSNWDECVIE
ncbi:MAG: hypothetical protein WD002_11145 [Pseudomonadales bacterium]